jgi:hypothetical protein
MKTETYYKAVRVINNKFYSVHHLGAKLKDIELYEKSPFLLKYEIEEITRPKYGNIFAFNSFPNAYKFAYTHLKNLILKGEGELVEPEKILSGLLWTSNIDIMIEVWEDPKRYETEIEFPKGTVQLKWFKPLEILTP